MQQQCLSLGFLSLSLWLLFACRHQNSRQHHLHMDWATASDDIASIPAADLLLTLKERSKVGRLCALLGSHSLVALGLQDTKVSNCLLGYTQNIFDNCFL
jgi:hypothetical protein